MSKIDSWNVKLRFGDKSINGGGKCGNVSYNTHLFCLAVEAGFSSDVVECWLRMLKVPGSILGRGKRCLSFFTCYIVISRFVF